MQAKERMFFNAATTYSFCMFVQTVGNIIGSCAISKVVLLSIMNRSV